MALIHKKVDFLVLGGGTSGLSAVFYLQKLLANSRNGQEVESVTSPHKKIVLLEASSRLGGWVYTVKSSEGSIHETGPRSMRPAGIVGKNSLNLASALGLDDEVLPVPRSEPAAQRRFVYARGKLCQLPFGIVALAMRRDPFSKPPAIDLAREMFVKRSKVEDETVYDFGVRRFGKEITQNLLDPFCRGIYAGRTTELSVRSCFLPLFNFERRYGSVVLGGLFGKGASDVTVGESALARRAQTEKWSVWSLNGGLQRLTDRLSEVTTENGADLQLRAPCTKIEFIPGDSSTQQQVARVHTPDALWETDQLISAIPASNLAEMLPADVSPLSQQLRQVKSATVAVVNLEFNGAHLPVEGFGYLVPSHEPSNVLGVIFDSCSFPRHDRPGAKTTRLTCMMGGAWFDDLFGDPDHVDPDWLASVALETLRCQIGLNAEPTFCRVNVSKDCIPNYRLNHHQLLEGVDRYVTEHRLPLTLVGSSYKGVSVNDCIYNARLAAQRLVPDGQLAL